MNERYDRFTTAVTDVYQSIQKIRMNGMKHYNLRSGHVSCLRLLYESDSGLTPTELAALSGMDKAAVSRHMAQMHEMGFANLEEAEGKHYKRKWLLSEKGKAAAVQIDEKIVEAVKAVGNDLSEEERKFLYVSMEKIRDNLHLYLKGEEQ